MTAHEVPCKCRLHRLRFVREHLPRSFYHDDVTGPDEAAATDAMQTCPVGAIESVDG